MPERTSVASIDLNSVLDQAWADKGLPEIMAAPVSALRGISDRTGELLNEALGIKTIADLASMPYARWAQALAELNAAAK
jgi:nucleotidyltransferase/DNA polymerase involved in DNA repair